MVTAHCCVKKNRAFTFYNRDLSTLKIWMYMSKYTHIQETKLKFEKYCTCHLQAIMYVTKKPQNGLWIKWCILFFKNTTNDHTINSNNNIFAILSKRPALDSARTGYVGISMMVLHATSSPRLYLTLDKYTTSVDTWRWWLFV